MTASNPSQSAHQVSADLALKAGFEEILAGCADHEISPAVLADLLAHELTAVHRLMLRLSAATHGVLGVTGELTEAEKDAGKPASDTAAADRAAARLAGSASRLMETMRQGLVALARCRPEAAGEGVWLALRWLDERCSAEELDRRIAAAKAARVANDPPPPKPVLSPRAQELRALVAERALELAEEAGVAAVAGSAADERHGVVFLATLYAYELGASHGLMMRLAGAADRAVDRAIEAEEEPVVALQLSGVVARLGDRFRRGMLSLRRLSGGPGGGPPKIAGTVWGGPDPSPGYRQDAPANDAPNPAAAPAVSAGHGVDRPESDAGAAPRGRPASPTHGRPHGGTPTSDPIVPAGHGVDHPETGSQNTEAGTQGQAASDKDPRSDGECPLASGF